MHLITCGCAPGCRARGMAASEILKLEKRLAAERAGVYLETPVMAALRVADKGRK